MSTLMDPPTTPDVPADVPPRRMTLQRSTKKDGLRNRIEFWALTHGPRTWRLVQRTPFLERRLNRLLINRAVGRAPARPYQFSTMGSYTTWPSLTDKTYNARQLKATGHGPRSEPAAGRVAALFRRVELDECPKSTVLFAYFAQWFTDGFLRTKRPDADKQSRDITRNISNHEVDLSQLYGMNADETEALRSKRGGRLKSELVDGAEFPPRLCGEDGKRLAEFAALAPVVHWKKLTLEQKRGLFAMGSDVANSQVGYAMLNVLFLREHNRVAAELAERYPHWDDERLFQTTRNVLVVVLVKLSIEDYINHITPYHFQFKLHPQSFGTAPWYRPNWECVEFNLLYRWHSLIPDGLRIDGADLPIDATVFNSDLLTERGLGAMFEDASRQRAGKVGLYNTSSWFAMPSLASVLQSREVELASYNDYRELCGYPRADDVDQISSDSRVREALRTLYHDVDDIELYVGLFAEDARPNSVLPPLMGRLVGVHAFSQLLTNPLLAPLVYNAETFSPHGMQVIASTNSLEQLVQRNVPREPRPYVSLRREGWRSR